MTVRMARARAVATLGALFATAATPVRAAQPSARTVTLTETGSTFLYPLFRAWAAAYAKRTPGVRIVAEASDSETGIARAVAGSVRIGASDAFMDDEAFEAAPGIINVPLALSAWEVVYNVPALPKTAPLRLDGPALAAIYSGQARTWDAPAIAALNPGLTLPRRTIVPVRRANGSGGSFIFSQYLAFSTPSWDKLVGYQTTVPWPAVDGALDAATNDAMLQAIETHPYAIGYVGGRRVAGPRLGTATLKNAAGNFIVPERRTVLAAAAKLGPRTPPDERLSLVFAPGRESYPLVSYEYAVVSTKQPDAAVSEALRNFLFWAIGLCNGNAGEYLDAAGLFALPESVRALSYAQIDSIGVLAR